MEAFVGMFIERKLAVTAGSGSRCREWFGIAAPPFWVYLSF
jgi:hypothetical protein